MAYRYHPDDPRCCQSGYEGSLTHDQEAALEKLQAAASGLDLRHVRGDYGEGFEEGDHAVEPLRLCLLRFLRGNAFSVSDALSQLENCVEHRRENPTDRLLSKPPGEVLACNVEEFNSFYPRWLMGYDRLGRPILATQYGSLRLWEMTKLTTLERMAELHAREQELLLRALRRRTLEGGRDGGGGGDGHIVDTAVVVVDTAGLTLRHVTKAFIKLFKMRTHMDQLLFPEMLGKCIIVNTPNLFSYVWSMLSPFVDERTRSKISIISRPQDWKEALRAIVDDPDQLSPEYGGTGARQQDLPSLADALYAAGGSKRSRGGDGRRGGVSGGASVEGRNGGRTPDDGCGRGAVENTSSSGGADAESHDVDIERAQGAPCSATTPGRKPKRVEEEKQELERGLMVNKGGERRGGSGAVSSWGGTLGWLWRPWGGGPAGVAGEGMGDDGRDAEESVAASDEEFFDALAELDQSYSSSSFRGGGESRESRQQLHRGGRSRLRSESTGCSTKGRDDLEVGRVAAAGVGGTASSAEPSTGSFGGTGSAVDVRGVGVLSDEGTDSGGGSGGQVSRRIMSTKLLLSAALRWCYAPLLRRLNQRSVDKLVRWLCLANAVSAMLAVVCVVAGAFSLSNTAVLSMQWCAITAVCLGSLLLLLALLGTAGARLRNRFSLLGFAGLEGIVAIGLLLSGTWCLALAGGSTTLSDLTWEALSKEHGMTGTKEDFIDGARSRLIFLGVSGLVLALFSVVGPCALASVLLSKIKNMEEEEEEEEEEGDWRNNEKRFVQLRRSANETNALCTIFAFVCTGYGGYALSFTIALGLGANVTSTYLLVAGGYLLLLAGAVGVWAAWSGRPDAFRIHFGALLLAGALYASLSVVQLASVELSDERVDEAWADLHTEGESLYSVQASVRTMLIVSGVLSAVTFALAACAAASSRAARNALLTLPSRSGYRHKSLDKLSRGEALAGTWALALATTSTFIDGSFAVFSAWLARDGEQAGVWCLVLWRAMGRGDSRYVEGDTFTVATSVIAAAVIGPGALLYAWAVYCRKGFRFSIGILVCTASLHTQVLRYVTSTESSSSSSGNGDDEDEDDDSGSKAFFIAASVILALLQVCGALAVLLYNVRRMTKRVHAAEVQYRALLLEHCRLSGRFENDPFEGGSGFGKVESKGRGDTVREAREEDTYGSSAGPDQLNRGRRILRRTAMA